MNHRDKLNHLYIIMEDAISKVFVKKDTRVKRRIIPHDVRKMLTKKSKLSKSIIKTKCSIKVSSLRQQYMDIEDSLAESYERFRYRKEMEIISNLKDNPSLFYSYARKKAVVQSSIGPLTTLFQGQERSGLESLRALSLDQSFS